MSEHGPASLGLIITALLLAALRVSGIRGEIFQAVAHLYVGGLFVAAYGMHDKLSKRLAWGLTLVETICATVTLFNG